MMLRLEFTKKIIFILGSLGLFNISNKLSNPIICSNSTKLIEFHIAGYVFYDGKTIENQIRGNEIVHLQQEKSNKHDLYAVEIYWNQQKLGYIPRQYNEIIFNILETNINLFGRIKNKNSNLPTWERMSIEIFI